MFFELFKISLLVIGGGYAIIVVADDVFGRRLGWLKDGELLDHLPVFQTVPGLIAGNTAIYVGMKVAGRLGAALGLLAVALPSFLVFLGISAGYAMLPVGNRWIAGALFALRGALTGVVLGTVAKSWTKSVGGVYGYVVAAVAFTLLYLGFNPALVMVGAMAAGIARQSIVPFPQGADDSAGIVPPLGSQSIPARVGLAVLAIAAIALALCFHPGIFLAFIKFGLLGFGGGFVLVPLYLAEFVGETAPMLQMPAEEFSNLMALTQATPGPVSVNAATFFGYRLGGVAGAAIATSALLLPSFFLLTFALTGMERWKTSRIVQGIVHGVRPATCSLLLFALMAFAGMSLWTAREVESPFSFVLGNVALHPVSLLPIGFCCWAVLSRKVSIMAAIITCAAAGALMGGMR